MTPFLDSQTSDTQISSRQTSSQQEPSAPLSQWLQFSQQRQTVAGTLGQMVDLLKENESANSDRSGQLGLSNAIAELEQAKSSLSKGTYRLMMMGDMKRGKSTLLNALIGENLLPSDVTPCTALLTVLRYGPEKRVVLHYKDNRPAKPISFETFKASYTISPDESKNLEAKGTEAFPDIDHVVVEYPLPLLQQGIELIDSPGLNDTEARNEQVLSYLTDCQAVLFVMSATQPLTLDERRYLNNYLQGTGLALFFVANGWDRIAAGLMDPEDAIAVSEAEAKVREVLNQNLAEFKPNNGELRLYETAALPALRQRIKGQRFTGTGIDTLLSGLDHFLACDRGPAELDRALAVAQKIHRAVSTSVSRRIPLLDETLETLQAKVASVESDFDKLGDIRDRYRQLIRTTSEQQAKLVSNSFKSYVLGLEATFEEDFASSQPDLEFVEFLETEKRQAFYREFKRAFERYINDRLAAWGFTAKQSIGTAFDELNESAEEYQVAYAEVVEIIHEKIMGQRYQAVGQHFDPERNSIWIDSIKDVFADIPANLNNTVRGFNYFWQSVLQSALAYVCVVIALQIIGVIFSSLFLNIVGVILAAGGILAVQAEFVRQEFLKATKKEFAKHLPKIATEQGPNIYTSVKDCFKAYEKQAIKRIDSDIDSRKVELTNLVNQKQAHEIDKAEEVKRLENLEDLVLGKVKDIEAIAQTPLVVPGL